MEPVLDEMEARVLGSLVEKELTTPDYYPLSLNALTNACNQKSNRDPVVSYPEETVQSVLEGLEQKGLVHKSVIGRVPKYEETFIRPRNLVTCESAVLCILLLRGPQTAGELRGRTERMGRFESLDEVHETLSRLQEWGYVGRLSRLAGHKEARYIHLLCKEPQLGPRPATVADKTDAAGESGWMENIESQIESLRQDLDQLKMAFEDFKRQFG
jgi:uncharacterized protein YceH (UPF0502 family)